MIDSATRAVRSVAATLVAATIAALVLAFVSSFWAAVGAVAWGMVYLGAWAFARRRDTLHERRALAEAHAAHVARLQHELDAQVALEREVERRQLKVIEDFRREHGV